MSGPILITRQKDPFILNQTYGNSTENSSARKTEEVAFNGSDAKMITAPRPAPILPTLTKNANKYWTAF